MFRRLMPFGELLCVVVFLSSCVAAPYVPGADYPTREDLATFGLDDPKVSLLTALDYAADGERDGSADSAEGSGEAPRSWVPVSWELIGPLPTATSNLAEPPDNAFEEALAQVAPEASFTEGLDCFAQQLAEFDRLSLRLSWTLERFTIVRCGAAASDNYVTRTVVLRTVDGRGNTVASNTGVSPQTTVRASLVGHAKRSAKQATPDDEVLAEYGTEMGQQLLAAGIDHQGGRFAFGSSVRLRGTQVVLTIVIMAQRYELDPVAIDHAGQTAVTVSGVELGDWEVSIVRPLSLGRTRDCIRDEEVAAPRFAFTCPLPEAERFVLLDVMVDGERDTSIAVSADGALPSSAQELVRAILGSEFEAGIETREELVDVINAVRVDAGLNPLMHSVEQGDLNAVVLPAIRQDPQNERRTGTAPFGRRVVSAGFELGVLLLESDWLSGTYSCEDNTWDEIVLDLLWSPEYRRTILQPETDFVAISEWRGDQCHRLIATYVALEETDTAVLEAQLRERIDAARARRGLGPLDSMRSRAAGALEAAVGRVVNLERALEPARSAMGKRIAAAIRRTIWSDWALSYSMRTVDYPPELLDADVYGDFRVGVIRNPDNHWAEYVVYYAWWW